MRTLEVFQVKRGEGELMETIARKRFLSEREVRIAHYIKAPQVPLPRPSVVYRKFPCDREAPREVDSLLNQHPLHGTRGAKDTICFFGRIGQQKGFYARHNGVLL